LFPKLVALLPDFDKRQALFEAYVVSARANAAQEWFTRLPAPTQRPEPVPTSDPTIVLAREGEEAVSAGAGGDRRPKKTSGVRLGAKKEASKQELDVSDISVGGSGRKGERQPRGKGKIPATAPADEEVTIPAPLPITAAPPVAPSPAPVPAPAVAVEPTLRPVFSALSLSDVAAASGAPGLTPSLSPVVPQDKLKTKLSILLKLLGKIVVRLYSEARDPAIFRITPADEAILDFQVSNCDDPALLALNWLPDIGMTPSSVPVLENLLQGVLADGGSTDFQPATAAIAEVCVCVLIALAVHLCCKLCAFGCTTDDVPVVAAVGRVFIPEMVGQFPEGFGGAKVSELQQEETTESVESACCTSSTPILITKTLIVCHS
jgi:hypothetical protein